MSSISSPKMLVGLISWVFVIMIGAWSFEHHTLSIPTAISGTSAFASSQPTGLAVLPGGPVGGVLPPGTIAPIYSYANDYSRGQCTWYVAGRRIVPGNWGNAQSWYGHAQATGWHTSSLPTLGAIAWTSAGYYGHVAIVENIIGNQVQVTEMNYLGTYRVDDRWTDASQWKYIY